MPRHEILGRGDAELDATVHLSLYRVGIDDHAAVHRTHDTVDGDVAEAAVRFLNDLLAFLLIAAAVYFFVVKPINALMARRKTEPDVDSPTKDCPECLSSIPVGARRCAFCTAEVVPFANADERIAFGVDQAPNGGKMRHRL